MAGVEPRPSHPAPSIAYPSYRLQRSWLLELPLHLLTRIICSRFAVEVEKRTEVEFGRLQ